MADQSELNRASEETLTLGFMQFIDLLGANGFANALPKMMEHAPMFVDDHLVAV